MKTFQQWALMVEFTVVPLWLWEQSQSSLDGGDYIMILTLEFAASLHGGESKDEQSAARWVCDV